MKTRIQKLMRVVAAFVVEVLQKMGTPEMASQATEIVAKPGV